MNASTEIQRANGNKKGEHPRRVNRVIDNAVTKLD
jgi:hypothetical protein